MAKISLRAYHREIESMIDSGHLEEAIGHCQHILKVHPKDLETYRLMAKAYLEAHRYTDAADLFQRVLFSVPDDFVSHLAMSLIRDEEKNLDAAIWHMERAFEQQPSNAALQAELKRLYGRRDGMEPLKIRLTRGALAQMYAKGEQYAQAIAEIRSVLSEDPDRTDLQVLLARVYFKAGQKVEATEICNTLLKKYPYNYEANRIMMEILPGTGRADSAQVYRQRVIQLDPYAAFLSESMTSISDVPDNTVMIDRFEWDPDAAAGYLSLPETTGQRDAEWMSIPETEQPTAALPAEEDTIPDFLKEAGWGPATGQF
ncbi:MAG: tetratricopeptide repeat protein, partial [Anaerolineales bacterium]